MHSKSRRRAGKARRPSLEFRYFGDDEREHAHRSAWETDTKTRQLCRQVQRRLELACSGELDDPLLQGLWIASVDPEPGGTALLVSVVVPDTARLVDVSMRLDGARGHLRTDIAAAIHRKRIPHLRFVVLPSTALRAPDEEDDDDD